MINAKFLMRKPAISVFALLLYYCGYCGGVLADQVGFLGRSPRALLMGDAYTALADDEFTLFYNPAALGGHKGMSAYLINPDISVTNALDELDRFDNFPSSDAAAISNRILGLPLHVHLGGTPGIKLGSFGFSLMANSTTNIIVRNAVHPSIDMEYRLDRGFIMGYAYSFGSGKKRGGSKRKKSKGKSSGNSAGNLTSVGLSVKNINRQGIFQNFDLFGLEILNNISANRSDMDALRTALGYSYGSGWGADLGVEYALFSSNSQLKFAASVMDIGDTRFIKSKGNREIQNQKMAVNTGASWSQDFFLVDYTFSVDISPINQGLPLGGMIRLGAEVGIPFASVLFGWNAGYVSYGVGINVWILKLYAGFYGVELGSDFRLEEGKRVLLYLSILDFSFDS